MRKVAPNSPCMRTKSPGCGSLPSQVKTGERYERSSSESGGISCHNRLISGGGKTMDLTPREMQASVSWGAVRVWLKRRNRLGLELIFIEP